MHTIPAATLEAALAWRYATKAFDAERRIPDDLWAALERTLVATPSSWGLQPWRFVVVTDPALKQQLRPLSWNQPQVTDCSHLVVFAARSAITEQDLDRLIGATAAARGLRPEALATYRQMMHADLIAGPRAAIAHEWAIRQCYIALGQFMLACALLGVDACPMEGIDPPAYDRVLGLEGSGYRTAVACAAGYRAASDKYAGLPKVRYPRSEVVIRR
ncbi:MAG: NAD(P)H-dependent oxidoreductase [Planctomycetota bacterium]|nr:NAD(P)H-dependent oxidoreductase [Planctomycetota bacterium]MCX8039799.1 NAD(P)H-dependent oxidoreductase [Planctomycetota bacterium]MDW8372915.1 NAD(P)H-dependent oxidoreductase [Planctomycetota bacterium]